MPKKDEQEDHSILGNQGRRGMGCVRSDLQGIVTLCWFCWSAAARILYSHLKTLPAPYQVNN